MATKIQLPEDFREFLILLKANDVEYLLVGGYAVGFYGYPRPTGDMDIWISNTQQNAEKIKTVLDKFGFSSPELSVELFTQEKSIVRMGVPPFKLEIITYIDGVKFEKCYAEKVTSEIDETEVNLISLENLKINKKASGRLKDLNDLENLP
jgi:hypothetical protein